MEQITFEAQESGSAHALVCDTADRIAWLFRRGQRRP